MKKTIAVIDLALIGFAAVFGTSRIAAIMSVNPALFLLIYALLFLGAAAAMCGLAGVYKRKLGIGFVRFVLASVLPTLIFSVTVLGYSLYINRTAPPNDSMFNFSGLDEMLFALVGIVGSAVLIIAMIAVKGALQLIKSQRATVKESKAQ